MNPSLQHIRNIGIMAHIDAGKTTTTERLLYFSGKLHKIGEVDEGTTAMDWMPQEQERGITIVAAATTFFWKDHTVNLIDTPGHVDFTVEVERSLRVLDGAVTVLCGVGGVEAQTETVWKQADKHHCPRIVYINKMDRLGADFERVLSQFRETLSPLGCAVQIPIGAESGFQGVIDLLEMKSYLLADNPENANRSSPIPESHLETARHYRKVLLETLAEQEDSLLESYVNGEEVPAERLKPVIRRLTLEEKIYPVFCGSSLRNLGVVPLLDGIVEYLPSPTDKPRISGFHPETHEEVKRRPDPKEPLAALAFKVVNDSFVGRLVYVRVYSGILKRGHRLFNATKNRKERAATLLRLHANSRIDVDEVSAGDIVGVLGLKFTKTGDSLCPEMDPILLEKMKFPEPVISMAVEARGTADNQKLEDVLKKFEDEDPTLLVTTHPETGQKLISGMGELHLEIIKDRMRREYSLELRVGKPQVAYRETPSCKVTTQVVVDRLLGGGRIYAGLTLELSPAPRGSGNRIHLTCPDAKIPKIYHGVIQETLKMSALTGFYGIYPLVDFEMNVTDGTYHEQESSETAFQMAAHTAYEKALKESKPNLLEPLMKLEVIVPEQFSGEIIGDLSARRGRIKDMESRDGVQAIHCEIPLARVFGYATVLRSLSSGRAAYTMEPLRFEVVPADQVEKIFQWE